MTTKRLTGLAYVPRWIGGTLCYITFGLGGLLCSLTILPLLRVWPGSETQKIRRVQYAVHLLFQFFVQMLTITGVIKVNTEYLSRLSNAKGMVVVANHPTLVDVVVLISLMPNAGCIVKQSIWRNPFMRGVVSCAGYIPNRGANLLLDDCQKILARDNNLIIFPEGTRTVLGKKINSFARGAANISLRTNTDILPVILRTNAPGLSKQEPWYEIPRKTIGMTVEIGEPIGHILYDSDEGGDAKMARKLTRDLEEHYTQQLSKTLWT